MTRRSVWLSDLAYAGMFFHLLLATSAHLNAGDTGFILALVALALLFASFLSENLGLSMASPNVPPGLARLAKEQTIGHVAAR